jgi:hypothetical protein
LSRKDGHEGHDWLDGALSHVMGRYLTLPCNWQECHLHDRLAGLISNQPFAFSRSPCWVTSLCAALTIGRLTVNAQCNHRLLRNHDAHFVVIPISNLKMSLLSKEAPINIVGAGIFGLSTALHLARRGYKNVTVFDKQPYDDSLYSYLSGCDAASAGLPPRHCEAI